MGRKVMRVPMGFDAPLNVIWEGYTIQDRLRKDFPVMSCSECDTKYNNCHEDADYCVFYNPIWRALWYYEPPTGPGYQLWETTTEGSP